MQVSKIKMYYYTKVKQLCQTIQQFKGEEGEQGRGRRWSPPSRGYFCHHDLLTLQQLRRVLAENHEKEKDKFKNNGQTSGE